MSTAEVARDMDVLRRAVGDKKLTYLGLQLRHRARPVLRQHVPGPGPRARRRRRHRPGRPGSAPSKTAEPASRTTRLRSADGAYRALQRDPEALRPAGAERTARSPAATRSANFDDDRRSGCATKPLVIADPDVRHLHRSPTPTSSAPSSARSTTRTPATGHRGSPPSCGALTARPPRPPQAGRARRSPSGSRQARRRAGARLPVRQRLRGVQRRHLHRRRCTRRTPAPGRR